MQPLARIEEVTVRHGLHVVVLRPTLRAAVTLERLHGGWEGLLLRLSQFHMTTMWAFIRASAVSQKAAEALLAALADLPLTKIEAALAEPLRELCELFFGTSSTGSSDGSAEVISWPEAYAQLYRIGTGWLGWTPADTWAATPNEITQAFEGKVAQLKAIHGVSDETDAETNSRDPIGHYTPDKLREVEELGHDPAFERDALRALKARHNA
ncbi:phage tail assembly chaperone [Alloyangia pacifica]|uniref:phage tail assembly chaperone n=1 Tax=Alloyangia pacifica TaxID=311180 RepID=UPI001CD2A97F|nr:phage tail assembly chaperone [Alloyangia pacifica]MCA0996300.1 phage tail assembly chaperone [Alloyangia pacifica]